MKDGLPEKVLQSLDETRRSFLSKLIVGSAFAVPSVASFSMSGLGFGDALADSVNLLCSNFCSNQRLDCSLIGTRKGNFSGCIYPGANLRGLDLSDDCLEGTVFAGANLAHSDLTCTILSEADLVAANLNGANLENALLGGAALTGANLNNANLMNSNLENANLVGANLQGADLTGAHLENANLQGANLHGATLTNVHWGNTTCPDGTNSDDPGNGNTCLLHLQP